MLCGVSSLFLRILCLLDLKGLLKCYHMLSLYTAVTNLMLACCFPDSVCGECVCERRQMQNDTDRKIGARCIQYMHLVTRIGSFSMWEQSKL